MAKKTTASTTTKKTTSTTKETVKPIEEVKEESHIIEEVDTTDTLSLTGEQTTEADNVIKVEIPNNEPLTEEEGTVEVPNENDAQTEEEGTVEASNEDENPERHEPVSIDAQTGEVTPIDESVLLTAVDENGEPIKEEPVVYKIDEDSGIILDSETIKPVVGWESEVQGVRFKKTSDTEWEYEAMSQYGLLKGTINPNKTELYFNKLNIPEQYFIIRRSNCFMKQKFLGKGNMFVLSYMLKHINRSKYLK